MKRHGYLFEQVIDMENLEEALRRASRRKRWQRKVQHVTENKDTLLPKLRESLLSRKFTTSEYRTKTIYEPKKRTIYILPFYPDRIVHHAIMLVMERIWDNLMDRDSYSCRKGKGQHRASDRCMEYAKQYKYSMQCDISKFYPSIPHAKLKALVRRKIKDPNLLWLLDDIIDSADGERNVPIGNYLSQWFGNLYMNELDKYARGIGITAYVRYCDDFLIFGDDKEELRMLTDKLEAYCNDALSLRLSKRRLQRTRDGIDFVGYRHFHDGKMLVRKRTALRIRRKLKKLPGKMAAGRITMEKARSVVAAADGWLGHAQTHGLQEAVGMWRLRGMVQGA